MTSTLKFLLSAHVVLGILGIACLAAVGLWLLKRELNISALKQASLWSIILLMASWLTGGYYYATYYGKAVRSVIKAGPYPWAHAVFMEAKEHIFLFLPFLALVIAIVLWSRGEDLANSAPLKKQLAILAGVVVILGIFITLGGAVISGAVR